MAGVGPIVFIVKCIHANSLISCCWGILLEGIDKTWNLKSNYSCTLFQRIRITQRINVLNTVYHVVGNWLKQKWLVFKREILVWVAAKNGQSVKSPVDFGDLARFKGQDQPLAFSFSLTELHFESVIILSLKIQSGCARQLPNLVGKCTFLVCSLDVFYAWAGHWELKVIWHTQWVTTKSWLHSSVHPLLEIL